MTGAAIIEMAGVRKGVRIATGENLTILEDIDLCVTPGEVVAIVGRSGAGKSTLLNILGLLDTADSGTYRCFGDDVTDLDDRELSTRRGRRFGFVFQQFQLLERRSVLDNVAVPLQFGGIGDLLDRRRAARGWVEQVGLGHRIRALPHTLSAGEQQRVAVARALVRHPDLVLADEPTGSLDVQTGECVLDLLLDLVANRGTTLIIVTHDLEVAARTDRTIVLENGRLRE